MTAGAILAERLEELLDAARELPPDGVLVADFDTPRERLLWAVAGRQWATNGRDWPADLPLPLTVEAALDVVEAAADDITDELVREIWRVVEALVPPELAFDVTTEVAAEWPWPDDLDTARDRALDRMARTTDRHPPRVWGMEEEIAEWVAAKVEATNPEYAAELRRNAPIMGGTLTTWVGHDGGRWPAAGLALVWHGEAVVRRRRYALDAWRYARYELTQWATDNVPPLYARKILDGIGEINERTAPDDVLDAAARELLLRGRHLARDVLALPEPGDDAAAIALAHKAADRLARLLNGEGDSNGPEEVRKDAKARAAGLVSGTDAGAVWLWWADRRWVERLALGLWRGRWSRAVRAPVLTLPVAERVGSLLLVTGIATGRDGGEVVTAPGDGGAPRAIADVRPPPATAVESEALLALVRAGAENELQTAIAPRLITYLISRIQRRFDEGAPLRWVAAGEESPWMALAREVGLSPKDDLRIKRVLHVLATTWHKIGPWEGNLLAVDSIKGKRGSPGYLEIKPTLPLQSGFGAKLSQHEFPSALAPLVVLENYRPPLPGRPNDYAAGHRLWLAFSAELAKGNEDIYRGYGAEVDLPALALAHRVPKPLIESAAHLTAWTNPDDPLIEVIEKGRYHLAPRFEAERAVLHEGGRRRIERRKAGRKGAEARAGKPPGKRG